MRLVIAHPTEIQNYNIYRIKEKNSNPTDILFFSFLYKTKTN